MLPISVPGTVDGFPRNLAQAQDFGEGRGETTHTYTRKVTITRRGNYLIKANARDLSIPPKQASNRENGIAVFPVEIYGGGCNGG